MTRLGTLGVGGASVGAVIGAGAVMAWALAYPQNSLSATLVRGIADCAAVVSLGLAVVPMFDDPRYRVELARRAAVPLILSSAVWLVAELVRLLLSAADAAGVAGSHLSGRTAIEFGVDTAAGRSGLVCVGAAAVCMVAAALPYSSTSRVVTTGAAAVGIAGRTLVGHVSASSFGGVAITLHALAAALWCGSLGALVLTIEHRGRWARVLPRFSRASSWCVLTLTVCGIGAAAVTLQSPAELVNTGYGRVLAAKILVMAALTIFAWRNRTWWLPAARTHRVTADVSMLRSRIELAGMAVALTLAAGLAVTG